ncbi:2-keto-4-pentenoate hydratase-like protein [Rippkaea orientalis PCC 8801]|uniref:2-keto-4-pentenoate hydratase-like protein n=2 Tax=Rippkaea TaxID=2546365 RepID=B7K520_RIPO1|nr:2-keto-4-pentenoate hydratase-like protein [Rippkaea orientalis PCC 8801]
MTKINYFLFPFFILLSPLPELAQVKIKDPLFKSNYHQIHNTNIADFKDDFITLSNQDLDKLAEKLANYYLTQQKIDDFPDNITSNQSLLIQSKFVNNLINNQGNIIGYKAGLTNQKIQERFNTNQPVLGTLLEKMLLPSGTIVSSKFGAIPMMEGDLMVRVKSEKINQAKTTEEVLNYLDAVIPFLELPDLMYSQDLKLNKEMLVAINVGARLGIMGEPIPLEATKEWHTKLSNIQVTIKDELGQELAQGNGKALLGDPLTVVLWIKDELRSQGKSLKKGDLLSLGSITPLIPVKPGKTISAQYLGLNEASPVQLSVHFEE